ncbi:MAG: M12 family metallopeptidase [Cyanobacteria bacterium P01_A01_bin.135]
MSDQKQYLPTQEVPVEKPEDKGEIAEMEIGRFYCALQERPARVFAPGVTSERGRLINLLGNKWVSGTVLRYYFFDGDTDGQNVLLSDGTTQWRTWVADEAQRAVVRRGFEAWKDVGIGIDFQEVDDREEAEIRIGFMRGDGAWSWLGRDILEHGPNERTMNFGWELTRPGELDTAIHEIGHTLGFPHEHQNPKAGIEWDEEAVYAALAQPPNNWDRQTTNWNIIRKLSASEVEGSTWDPDSVMHYPFGRGLIKKPEQYANGLRPAGGLSAKDKAWVKSLYPPVQEEEEKLKPSQSVLLNISAGEQRHFTVMPEATRYYQFQTFGTSDTVMVLFEEEDGQLRYRTGDDDSGQDTNAFFRIKLIKGRRYVLRIRLYYSDRPGETAVMMW